MRVKRDHRPSKMPEICRFRVRQVKRQDETLNFCLNGRGRRPALVWSDPHGRLCTPQPCLLRVNLDHVTALPQSEVRLDDDLLPHVICSPARRDGRPVRRAGLHRDRADPAPRSARLAAANPAGTGLPGRPAAQHGAAWQHDPAAGDRADAAAAWHRQRHRLHHGAWAATIGVRRHGAMRAQPAVPRVPDRLRRMASKTGLFARQASPFVAAIWNQKHRLVLSDYSIMTYAYAYAGAMQMIMPMPPKITYACNATA